MGDLKYIGKITLKSLRDAILDYSISSSKAILLHPHDFDDMAVDYRNAYGVSLKLPFVFLGIYIAPSENPSVPLGRIRVEQNIETPRQPTQEDEACPPFTIAYRCGWCGNVVAEDGSLLDGSTRMEYIRILEKYGSQIEHIKVHGDCCRNNH
jgi:hypothetical protein